MSIICSQDCLSLIIDKQTHYISWLVIVKAVSNHGVDCSVTLDTLFCSSFVFGVYVVFCSLVFSRQYQCNRLPGKIRLRNDLLRVGSLVWDVKPTHSLTYINKAFKFSVMYFRC